MITVKLDSSVVAVISSTRPLQLSSIPFPGISETPGLTFELKSSQSLASINPSPSRSSSGVLGLQSSSMPLYAISADPGLIASLLSSQSFSLLNPSLSRSSSNVEGLQSSSMPLYTISNTPGLLQGYCRYSHWPWKIRLYPGRHPALLGCNRHRCHCIQFLLSLD